MAKCPSSPPKMSSPAQQIPTRNIATSTPASSKSSFQVRLNQVLIPLDTALVEMKRKFLVKEWTAIMMLASELACSLWC